MPSYNAFCTRRNIGLGRLGQINVQHRNGPLRDVCDLIFDITCLVTWLFVGTYMQIDSEYERKKNRKYETVGIKMMAVIDDQSP